MPAAAALSSFTIVSIGRGKNKPGICTVYHSSGSHPDISGLSNVRLAYGRELLAHTRVSREVAVILADASMLDFLHNLLALPPNVIVVATDAATEQALGGRVDLSLTGVTDPAAQKRLLNVATQYSGARVIADQCRRQLLCTRRDLHEVKKISIGLMYERDQKQLLQRIVAQGMRLTESDAACLFLIEADKHNVPLLRPALF